MKINNKLDEIKYYDPKYNIWMSLFGSTGKGITIKPKKKVKKAKAYEAITYTTSII